jgi:hypothetical protein
MLLRDTDMDGCLPNPTETACAPRDRRLPMKKASPTYQKSKRSRCDRRFTTIAAYTSQQESNKTGAVQNKNQVTLEYFK